MVSSDFEHIATQPFLTLLVLLANATLRHSHAPLTADNEGQSMGYLSRSLLLTQLLTLHHIWGKINLPVTYLHMGFIRICHVALVARVTLLPSPDSQLFYYVRTTFITGALAS